MRFAGSMMIMAALAAACMPVTAHAQGQWKSYVSHDLGFSFMTPGEVKIDKGTWKGERSGDRPAYIFTSSADNIEYKATVVDLRSQMAEAPSVLEEAVATFQGRNKTLMDNYGRVGNIYGRKDTVELTNNSGRQMASFYINNGRLYIMQATILPANGDYGTPDAARFVDSEVFVERQMDPDATPLKLPN